MKTRKHTRTISTIIPRLANKEEVETLAKSALKTLMNARRKKPGIRFTMVRKSECGSNYVLQSPHPEDAIKQMLSFSGKGPVWVIVNDLSVPGCAVRLSSKQAAKITKGSRRLFGNFPQAVHVKVDNIWRVPFMNAGK